MQVVISTSMLPRVLSLKPTSVTLAIFTFLLRHEGRTGSSLIHPDPRQGRFGIKNHKPVIGWVGLGLSKGRCLVSRVWFSQYPNTTRPVAIAISEVGLNAFLPKSRIELVMGWVGAGRRSLSKVTLALVQYKREFSMF